MLLCLINWPAFFCTCPGFLEVQQQHNTYATGEQLCVLDHAMDVMGLPDKHREASSVCVQSPVVVHASGTWLISPLQGETRINSWNFFTIQKKNYEIVVCYDYSIAMLSSVYSGGAGVWIVTENTLANCFGTVINTTNK